MESLLTDESSPVWVVRYMSAQEADTLIALCTENLEKHESTRAHGEQPPTSAHPYRALLLRATAYVKQNKFHLALEDYNAMLRYNSENTDVLYNRGVAYEKVGRIDDAIAAFTKVLHLEPDHVNAAYSRAACQNLRGDFEDAIDDYMRALQLEQNGKQTIYTTPNGRELRRPRSSNNLQSMSIEKPLLLSPDDC